MIKFGGVELTNIAPVKIEDVVVSPVQLTPVARQRAVQFGADFVRMGGSTRKVTVTFALLISSLSERESIMQDIHNWAKIGNGEQTLELPQWENRHLECAVTQLPDHSYRKWWENKLRIVFTCFNNPYWTSNELIEVGCGNYFSIGGSAPPLMTIERYGVTPLTNATYSSPYGSMTFSTIPAGSFKADLNRQTASIGSTSIMQYYVPTSTWIVPQVGAYQYINGTGTVKYRERWV